MILSMLKYKEKEVHYKWRYLSCPSLWFGKTMKVKFLHFKKGGKIMNYKKITEENKKDLLLPNEPFDLWGKLMVDRKNSEWTYAIEQFEEIETMVFPEEKYEFAQIQENGFAIGAYHEGKCVGLAIYQYNWNKYIYLYDLKVKRAFRKRGIASELIKEGLSEAEALGYKGIYTVGQDNNLTACLFYLNQGFEIGGFNTRDYDYTKQEGKADVYFYLN